MNLEDIQSYCLSLPGATEDIKWGNNLVFSVGSKMFAITGIDTIPAGISFKVPAEQFDELADLPDYKPAPYLARAKWIAIEDISRIDDHLLKKYIADSYNLVKNKLSKKARENSRQ